MSEFVTFEKVNLGRIEKYRKDYFSSMSEFQELFLEIMIKESDFYLIKDSYVEIGYFILNNERDLIEFYLLNNYDSISLIYFRKILSSLPISSIYCKSFDIVLLNSCLLSSFPYVVIGKMYREYNFTNLSHDGELIMEKANLSHADLLLNQDESIKELFETKQHLIDFIIHDDVFIFKQNNELYGCGMVIKTHSDWNFCDLGVWVHPSKRGNSYGSMIILSLKNYAIQNEMSPSCGCAIQNFASQKTIEKSGFVSRYLLIKFDNMFVKY